MKYYCYKARQFNRLSPVGLRMNDCISKKCRQLYREDPLGDLKPVFMRHQSELTEFAGVKA